MLSSVDSLIVAPRVFQGTKEGIESVAVAIAQGVLAGQAAEVSAFSLGDVAIEPISALSPISLAALRGIVKSRPFEEGDEGWLLPFLEEEDSLKGPLCDSYLCQNKLQMDAIRLLDFGLKKETHPLSKIVLLLSKNGHGNTLDWVLDGLDRSSGQEQDYFYSEEAGVLELGSRLSTHNGYVDCLKRICQLAKKRDLPSSRWLQMCEDILFTAAETGQIEIMQFMRKNGVVSMEAFLGSLEKALVNEHIAVADFLLKGIEWQNKKCPESAESVREDLAKILVKALKVASQIGFNQSLEWISSKIDITDEIEEGVSSSVLEDNLSVLKWFINIGNEKLSQERFDKAVTDGIRLSFSGSKNNIDISLFLLQSSNNFIKDVKIAFIYASCDRHLPTLRFLYQKATEVKNQVGIHPFLSEDLDEAVVFALQGGQLKALTYLENRRGVDYS